MRLFIAVLFDEIVKASLYDTVVSLSNNARSGTFTLKENLHLTMNYIGETDRLEEVKKAMEQAVRSTKAETFPLLIRGFGKFRRNDGDIYWLGVEKEASLWRMQRELVKQLRDAGFFDIDEREYKPHLTLGRRVKVPREFKEKDFAVNIQPIQMMVSRISLIKSERLQGKLTYTEIHHIDTVHSQCERLGRRRC